MAVKNHDYGVVLIVEVSIQADRWRDILCDPERYVEELATSFLEDLGSTKSESVLSIVLADDALLLELNSTYRNISKPTNVLSFNYENVSYNSYMGEIFLSVERIETEAAEMQISFPDHLAHMLIHGILHLLGYDHNTPEETEKMQAVEISLLRKKNIANPYEI